MFRRLFSAALLLLCFAASPAFADGAADEAELHFQLAAERYIARDYLGALEHFLLSNRLVPNRNVVFNIARTFEQLSRFPEAYRYYVDALEAEPDPTTRSSLEAAIARIAPHVAVFDVQTTPPGATLYIDRVDLGSQGSSPRRLAFGTGTYKILARRDGYEPAESPPLEAVLGRTIPVVLELEHITGTLKILAREGTEVRTDTSTATFFAPCTLELAPGTHTLVLALPGHQSATRTVNIVARKESSLYAQLLPEVGSLLVSTEEKEALVEVDGASRGFTPVVISDVPVGLRRVRVSLRGFSPVEREVEVRANEQTSLPELRLEPLREVTAASRNTEAIEDAPGSVTVISGQELRAFGYPTVAEALRGTRGISLSNDAIYSSINVRGIGQPNDYNNRLLLLSDGMVLNDNIIASAYVGYDGRVDLEDIERIELVRGSGSLLYGTGAMSGVINLVTRPRETYSSVSASAGTADNAVARVRGAAQLHFSADTGLWTSLAYARSDGREGELSTGASSTSTPGLEKFDAATLAGRFWSGPFTLQWFYAAREQSAPFGPFGTLFGDPDTRVADRRGMAELRFERPLAETGELLLRVHAHLYEFEGFFVYDDRNNDERYRGLWFGAEARYSFAPLTDPRALRLSFGLSGERHVRADIAGATLFGSSVQTYLDEAHPYSVGAIYAVAEGSPIEWFRYSAGLRLDSYSTSGVSLNPRLALIFRPHADGVLKIFGGRSFRVPSIYELFYNDGRLTQERSNDLEPEDSFSAEIEYSHHIFRDWIALVAVHTTYLENIIETRGDGTAFSLLRYQNSTEPVLTAGAELELRREWRQGWMLAASYGYQSARYRDRPEREATGNLELINAPAHLAALRGAVPLVPGVATLAARIAFEGPRRISLLSDEQTRAALVADLVLRGEVPRYHLNWSAGVYNLLDWRYDVPITEGAVSPTMRQQGRTFLLSLGIDVSL